MGGILGLILLILDIWAIIDIVKSGRPAGQKALWIILVLLLPLIGLIVYFVVGRKK